MWACVGGKYDVVEELVTQHNAPADYVANKQETALMKAAASGRWYY